MYKAHKLAGFGSIHWALLAETLSEGERTFIIFEPIIPIKNPFFFFAPSETQTPLCAFAFF